MPGCINMLIYRFKDTYSLKSGYIRLNSEGLSQSGVHVTNVATEFQWYFTFCSSDLSQTEVNKMQMLLKQAVGWNLDKWFSTQGADTLLPKNLKTLGTKQKTYLHCAVFSPEDSSDHFFNIHILYALTLSLNYSELFTW